MTTFNVITTKRNDAKMQGLYYCQGVFVNARANAESFTEKEADNIVSNSAFYLKKVPELKEAKAVIYLVREKCKTKGRPILFASINEAERNSWHKNNASVLLSNFESVDEIVNLADFLIKTEKSLGGLEKLLLETPVDQSNVKKAIFLVTTYGSDGRGKESVVFASESESERDDYYKNSKFKNYYSQIERVIDISKEKTSLINQLSGLEKLVLNIEQN